MDTWFMVNIIIIVCAVLILAVIVIYELRK